MYIFFALFILLLFSTLVEYFHKSTPKVLFYILFVIFFLMLSLRYGQGTDYLSYSVIFKVIPSTLNPMELLAAGVPQEIGWLELYGLFHVLHASFQVFIFALSLVEACLFYRFINRFCKYKILALTLSYPTLYLTYMFSALRQGLVISVFLGVLLEFYLDNKYWKYIIGCLILTTIHSSALILLIILFVRDDKLFNYKAIIYIIIAWLVGFFVYFGGKSFVSSLPFIPARVASYITVSSISIASIGERVLSFVFVTLLFTHKKDLTCEIKRLYNAYCFSMIIYGVLLWNPLLASRFCYAFKALEIILISNLLYYDNSYVLNKVLRFCFIIVLTFTMYLKNINSYIEQGSYNDNVNAFSYPYVSLIKKNISDYREYNW